MVKLRLRLGRVNEKPLALENGSDLHVNKRQKIRHYHARSTGEEEEEEKEEEEEEEEGQMAIFYFVRHARKLRYRGDVIQSFYWKSATKHNGGV